MYLFHTFHRKLYTLPLMVYTHYFYAYVLVYADHCGRVAHELVGKLGDMYKAVLLYTYIHETAEVPR